MKRLFPQLMLVLYLMAVTLTLAVMVTTGVLFERIIGYSNLGAILTFLVGEIAAFALLVKSFIVFRRNVRRVQAE